MRFWEIRKGLALLVGVMSIATLATGQEFRGRVQGKVTDSTNAVVTDAKVVLKNDGTGVEVSRKSDSNGGYLFDYVDPATYTITVEKDNFKTKVQKNVLVQQRGDVTVDMSLEVGNMSEMVTVTESPVAVQFTTASRDLTIEAQMVRDLPVITRNPYGLAALDPLVVNQGSAVETQPYHHRTANEQSMGGGTKYRNDILLDGTPLTAGNKLGYTPPMDAVTEYTIQQNSVDAEFGHNSGGVAIVTMKSGTNEVHGTAYYYGRDASLNAVTTRVGTRQHNESPYWNAGATVGFPIKKNKIFMFAVFEKINNTDAPAANYSLPTALERQGDFSQSFNTDGTLRTIYNPWSTRLGPDGKTYIRDPFPGNKIPQDMIDPVAAKIMANLWQPNATAQDSTGLNNFAYQDARTFAYYNFSTRLDWQIKENWKAYARVSRMKTDQTADDYTNGQDPLKLRNTTGSKRNGWNIAADTVYMFNPTTSLNVRGSFYAVEDKRDFPEMDIANYGQFWPSGWWQSYMATRPLVYSPSIVVESAARAQFGVPNFWYQEPSGTSAHVRFNKYYTKHTVKVGAEARFKRGQAARFRYGNFTFGYQETANSFSSPNSKTGVPWASFLIGAMNSNTNIQYSPMQKANTEMYALYFQDDFKMTKNITLNLGLRYEYEGGYWDPQNRLQQGLDLTVPISGMQGVIDPLMQSTAAGTTGMSVAQLMAQSAGQKSFVYNGAFQFTEDGDNRSTKADGMQFMPRIGLAWRLDDKSVLRAGYGRFYTPTSLIMPDRDANGEIPMGLFSPTTNVLAQLAGVPQAKFQDPFPQGLTQATGKKYGAATLLGDAITWDKYEQKPPISDRINVSLQRELPGRVIVDATYMINFVSRDQWTQQLNIADPRLAYTYGTALNALVANPFLNYGTADSFPGPLRGRSTVSVSSLLVPYPQYGTLLQTAADVRKTNYKSFTLRFQKPMAHGVSFMMAYAYATSRTQAYYDIQDEYDGILTWMDGYYQPPGGTGTNLGFGNGGSLDPVHRVVCAASAEIPIGRKRAIGGEMPAALDAVVGGWQLSGTFTYNSGGKLIFGTAVQTAPPTFVGETAPGKWFDGSGLTQLPSNTRRANPWYYDDILGPAFTNLDLALAKTFDLSQRFKLQLRAEAYNALNHMSWANPNMTVTSSDFGKTTTQRAGYYGRQIQYSARLRF
jgi:hypothetical protein